MAWQRDETSTGIHIPTPCEFAAFYDRLGLLLIHLLYMTINAQFEPFGDKYVTKSPTPWSTQYFSVYGLALRPQSARFPYDPTMTVPHLEKMGWRF